MTDHVDKATAKSSAKSAGVTDILHASGVNPGATATTLSYLADISKSFGLTDEWTDVRCADGTKARVLKNPARAFDLYAKEWTTKFDFTVELLDKAKIGANPEVNKKIVRLFDNLGSVDAALREMYKNSYLTFAATPCSESAQREKQRMDRIVAAIGLSLISFKMMIENGDLDKATNEIPKLIDKLTDLLLRQ